MGEVQNGKSKCTWKLRGSLPPQIQLSRGRGQLLARWQGQPHTSNESAGTLARCRQLREGACKLASRLSLHFPRLTARWTHRAAQPAQLRLEQHVRSHCPYLRLFARIAEVCFCPHMAHCVLKLLGMQYKDRSFLRTPGAWASLLVSGASCGQENQSAKHSVGSLPAQMAPNRACFVA